MAAGKPLARLRMELSADSAQLQKGLKDATAAMGRASESMTDASARIAASAEQAGKAMAGLGAKTESGIDRMAEKLRSFSQLAITSIKERIIGVFFEMGHSIVSSFSMIFDSTSETFQAMSEGSQRASLVVQQSFAGMRDGVLGFAHGFVHQLLDRVLPGVAQLANQIAGLAERLGNLPAVSSSASIALEAMAVAFKTLVTGGALVVAVVEAILHIVGTAAQALLAFATGQFKEAYEHIQSGAEAVAETVRTTAQTIIGIWDEATPDPASVDAAWTPVVSSMDAVSESARKMRDTILAAMDAVVNSPTETAEAKLEAVAAAYESGAIGARQFGRLTKRINDENVKNMHDLASATASALTSIFGKSKLAAIASAVINTAQAITRNIAQYPGPLGAAMAGIAAATGAAQIAAIKSTNMGGGGGSAPSVSTAAAAAPVASQMLMVQGLDPNAIMSGASVRDLAERLLAFQADGGQVVLQ